MSIQKMRVIVEDPSHTSVDTRRTLPGIPATETAVKGI